jgi:membrane protein implicated in regulation of membrane protease activity
MRGKVMVGIAIGLIIIAFFMLFFEYNISWYYAFAALLLVFMATIFTYYGFRKWDEEDKIKRQLKMAGRMGRK